MPRLSTHYKYKDDRPIWVRVEPVRWLINKKAKLVLSKKVLVGGVPYQKKGQDVSDFEKTIMKRFLTRCFAEDLKRTILKEKERREQQ